MKEGQHWFPLELFFLFDMWYPGLLVEINQEKMRGLGKMGGGVVKGHKGHFIIPQMPCLDLLGYKNLLLIV
jgi:hypothetical protein